MSGAMSYQLAALGAARAAYDKHVRGTDRINDGCCYCRQHDTNTKFIPDRCYKGKALYAEVERAIEIAQQARQGKPHLMVIRGGAS